jgi:hypothetical protein
VPLPHAPGRGRRIIVMRCSPGMDPRRARLELSPRTARLPAVKSRRPFPRLKKNLCQALLVGGLILLLAGCASMSKPTVGVSGYDETRPMGSR